VLLGPAERDEADAWRRRGVAVSDGLDLVTAAALTGAAPVWIGNDSGMSHLANVLGRRGVVLFGPTRAARFGPRDGLLAPVDTAGRARADVAREVRAHVLAADGA
jgi:ADP-heptose:LPS heptosyltransferase